MLIQNTSKNSSSKAVGLEDRVKTNGRKGDRSSDATDPHSTSLRRTQMDPRDAPCHAHSVDTKVETSVRITAEQGRSQEFHLGGV